MYANIADYENQYHYAWPTQEINAELPFSHSVIIADRNDGWSYKSKKQV